MEYISLERVFAVDVMLKNGYPTKSTEKLLPIDIFSTRNDEPGNNEGIYLKIPYILEVSRKK